MNDKQPYPIGTPGRKWGEDEKKEWLAQQQIQRSYSEQVLTRLEELKERFVTDQYGALSCSPDRFTRFY